MRFDESVIELDSDEEMDDMAETVVTEWYSNYLKKLERQYPNAFDKIVNDIVGSKQMKMKKNALKNVLGKLSQKNCLIPV